MALKHLVAGLFVGLVAVQAQAGKIENRNSFELINTGEAGVISDQARLKASKKWEAEGTADALIGVNGQVEYAYGQSRPNIVCAPLHLCTIQLIPGESVMDMAIGDSVRWTVKSALAGDRPIIVVKPTQFGIKTNLTITTNQGRVYYLNLSASKSDYVPMVSFYDPDAIIFGSNQKDNEIQTLKTQLKIQEAELSNKHQNAETRRMPGSSSERLTSDLDFNWSCTPSNGTSKSLQPTNIFSSGGHIYVKYPNKVNPDLTTIFTGEEESSIVTNYRISDGYYIIDGNYDNLQFLVNEGVNKTKTKGVSCVHKEKVSNYSYSSETNDAARILGGK